MKTHEDRTETAGAAGGTIRASAPLRAGWVLPALLLLLGPGTVPAASVPARPSLAAGLERATERARAGLSGDPLRIPFQVQNTVNRSHPGLPVKGGIPLPRGLVSGTASFRVLDRDGTPLPAQVNPTAWWPDGSLKWVLVLTTASQQPRATRDCLLEISRGTAARSEPRLLVHEGGGEIRVDTGVITFSVPHSGADVLTSLTCTAGPAPVPVLGPGGSARLVASIEREEPAGPSLVSFVAGTAGVPNEAMVEEAGPERVVIRLRGTHAAASGEAFAPFTLRLYAHAGSGVIRFVHSFVYTGDPERDFLRSIGFRLGTTMGRVTAFALAGEGGRGVVTTCDAGPNRPAWSRGLLAQNGSVGYSIRKWIDPAAHSAVKMEEGARSQGWGRIDGAGASVALGIRNFWQEYPKAVAIDVPRQEIVAHLYSPHGDRLDLRRYSDHTHSELYETSTSGPAPAPVAPESDWAGRLGPDDLGARFIGKTSEFFLDVSSGEDPDRTGREAAFFQDPPLLTPGPGWLARTRVFGDWAPLGATLPAAQGRLVQEAADFLAREQEERAWYSFLDYGDMVHSFDPRRDTWRHDEGGYAWNNNEHCISEGLWAAYLHTGDPAHFRIAEAMTRHVGDVDMYHLGPLAGNGSRHNVNHYGCTAKKRRMTLPENKRVHYFLTGDEHTRDLIHFIHRSFAENTLEEEVMRARRNTMDLAVYASALLFLWETTGEERYGALLRTTTETLCSFRINGRGIRQYLAFDLATGRGGLPEGPGLAQTKFRLNPRPGAGLPGDGSEAQTKSFLLKFGPMDMLLNTVELTGSEAVHAAILDWAELLHLPPEEARRFQGRFQPGLDCGRVAAYAYRHTGDPRYRDYLADWLARPVVWFERVGRAGEPEGATRLIARNGEPGSQADAGEGEKFQLRDMADLLRNAPYGWAALESGPASGPQGEQTVARGQR